MTAASASLPSYRLEEAAPGSPALPLIHPPGAGLRGREDCLPVWLPRAAAAHAATHARPARLPLAGEGAHVLPVSDRTASPRTCPPSRSVRCHRLPATRGHEPKEDETPWRRRAFCWS